MVHLSRKWKLSSCLLPQNGHCIKNLQFLCTQQTSLFLVPTHPQPSSDPSLADSLATNQLFLSLHLQLDVMDWDNTISIPNGIEDGSHTEAHEWQWPNLPTETTAMFLTGNTMGLTQDQSSDSSTATHSFDRSFDSDMSLFHSQFFGAGEDVEIPPMATWNVSNSSDQNDNVTTAASTFMSELFAPFQSGIAPSSLHLPGTSQPLESGNSSLPCHQ